MKTKIKNVEEKEKLVDKAYRLGLEYEKSSHYCAQCVVAALQEVFQIKDEGIFRAAYPLSGGIGSTTDGSCGALSGGVIILGYLYGRGREDFGRGISNKRATYFAKKLCDRFIQEFGSLRCKDIQIKLFGRSFDFWDENDKKAFEEAGGHRDKCPTVVAKACAWTAEIIQNEINFPLQNFR